MYPLLVDVSHHQGEMNWVKTKAAGAAGAIIRVGTVDPVTGLPFEDRQYGANLKALDLMPCAVFWYWMPKYDTTRQADFLVKLIQGKPFRKIYIDVEDTGGRDPEALADRLLYFIDLLKARTTIPIGIYTRGEWWNINVGPRAAFEQYELWVARYNPALSGPWADVEKYRPREWNAWRLWQFSADGNGRGAEFGAQSVSIDLDYFNGTEAEFRAWAGLPPIVDQAAQYRELKQLVDELTIAVAGLQKVADLHAGALTAHDGRLDKLQTAIDENAYRDGQVVTDLRNRMTRAAAALAGGQ